MEDKVSEAQTCALKNYTLNLSDADTERIARKAGKYNMSVSKLLERFIADLIDGTYTNGSDERMYANQWFNRCWFAHESDRNLITYICDSSYDLEYIPEICESIKDTKKRIQDTLDKIDNPDYSWQEIPIPTYDDAGNPAVYIRTYTTHEDFVADCRDSIENYEEDLENYTSRLDDIKDTFSFYMGSRTYDWDKELQAYLQWYDTSVPDIIE